MTKMTEVYRCAVCGAVVEVLNGGGGTLHCCGKPMERMEAHTAEQGAEKHLPVATPIEGGYRVQVGQVPHPMTNEHHIQWIEMLTSRGVHHQQLRATDKPEALFFTTERPVAFRAFCNLHGLWLTECRATQAAE